MAGAIPIDKTPVAESANLHSLSKRDYLRGACHQTTLTMLELLDNGAELVDDTCRYQRRLLSTLRTMEWASNTLDVAAILSIQHPLNLAENIRNLARNAFDLACNVLQPFKEATAVAA